MSAKFNGFTVAFEQPVSQEYMDKVKEAVGLFEGVIAVETVEDNHTERKAQRDRAEAQQSYEMSMVKINLLKLLKKDLDFVEQLRKWLNAQPAQPPISSLSGEKRCC